MIPYITVYKILRYSCGSTTMMSWVLPSGIYSIQKNAWEQTHHAPLHEHVTVMIKFTAIMKVHPFLMKPCTLEIRILPISVCLSKRRSSSISKLPTGHVCFFLSPEVITDSAPLSIEKDLHTARAKSRVSDPASCQPYSAWNSTSTWNGTYPVFRY